MRRTAQGGEATAGPAQSGPRLVAVNEGLVVRRIGKRFRKRPVVRDVSLGVQRGEAVGFRVIEEGIDFLNAEDKEWILGKTADSLYGQTAD